MEIVDVIKKIRAYDSPNKKFGNLIEYLKTHQDDGAYTETNPGSANLSKIRSITETAYQRAIFNAKKAILTFNDGEERVVTWYDLV